MMRILIVDDDVVIVNILQRIIEQCNLGDVVATASNGLTAESLILEHKPDLVMVDLLLPGQDGISLVSKIQGYGMSTHFIMLSQVVDKNMVGEAYTKGIDFFVSKPINSMEIISVIRRVGELSQLKSTFKSIESAAKILSSDRSDPNTHAVKSLHNRKLRYILTDIGIMSDLSSKDLSCICALIHENFSTRKAPEEMHLTELLSLLQDKYLQENGITTDAKTIEMRIRRGVTKALRNLASLGIEDYGHEKFVEYSTSLFDYSDIKAEMDFLRGKTTIGGKVNIRSFIRRLIMMTDPNIEN